jgi:hypothetical protein
MTIDTQKNYEINRAEELKIQQSNIIQQIQQQVTKEAASGKTSPQQQMMQLLTNAPNLNSTQQMANEQIKKGYLDVKI